MKSNKFSDAQRTSGIKNNKFMTQEMQTQKKEELKFGSRQTLLKQFQFPLFLSRHP